MRGCSQRDAPITAASRQDSREAAVGFINNTDPHLKALLDCDCLDGSLATEDRDGKRAERVAEAPRARTGENAEATPAVGGKPL